MPKRNFIIIYYRSIKEKVGGSGRLLRLVKCIGADFIDNIFVNNIFFRNIFVYIFQISIVALITLRKLKEILAKDVIIFQSLSLPAGIFIAISKALRKEKIILDDFNFHSKTDYILFKLFSHFISEVWTSSFYSIIYLRNVCKNSIKIKYVPTPLFISDNVKYAKRNIILYVSSKSFPRYVAIGKKICRIAEKFPIYTFLIVGTVCEDLEKDPSCFRDNVKLLGLVSETSLDKLLRIAKYLVVFDTEHYIYPGGMLIKIVDAVEHHVIPIISYQFRYSFPFIKFIYTFEDLEKAITKGISIDFYFLRKIYGCERIRKIINE